MPNAKRTERQMEGIGSWEEVAIAESTSAAQRSLHRCCAVTAQPRKEESGGDRADDLIEPQTEKTGCKLSNTVHTAP